MFAWLVANATELMKRATVVFSEFRTAGQHALRQRIGHRECIAVVARAAELLATVKVSPASGVSLICTRQPLMSMFEPGV